MFEKHRLWILSIVLILCSHQISSEESDSDKIKREVWSSGSFNTFSADNKNNNNNDKSLGQMSPFAQVFAAIDSLGLKMNGNVKTTVEFWPPDMDKDKFYKLREEDSAFPLTSWFNFMPLVKEIKEPEISYPVIVNDNKKSHEYAESTDKQLNNDNYSTKSLKDYTTKPGIIRTRQKKVKHEYYTVKPEIHDTEYVLSTAKPEVNDNGNNFDVKYYKSTIKRPEVISDLGYENINFKSAEPEVIYEHSFVQSTEKPLINNVVHENAATPIPSNDHSSTEQIINNSDESMANVGPVIFPALGLTEQRTHEFITYVPTTASSPRANKKRKLKKKVKTSSITQFSIKEKHITQAPPALDVDVIAETSSEYTPIKEIIDNDSIQYTDIISNLSNLTELSFSSYNNDNSTGNNHQYMQQSDHQKSIKNNIYSSKVNHSTTEYGFIINVEPEKVAETQDDVIDDKIKSTTEIPLVTLSSSSLPIEMKKMEPLKDSPKAAEKKIKQKVNDDNDKSNKKFKIIVESSSPMSNISNSIDEKYFTTTESTAKKLNQSRYGVRNFRPRVKSQTTVRNHMSSTASSYVASTTVKSIPKRIKTSTSTHVSTSSEKPINDYMMYVMSTRYYTPKSRSRHQNSRIKQTTTKSSALSTKMSTIKTKMRRTTKKLTK